MLLLYLKEPVSGPVNRFIEKAMATTVAALC